MKNINLFLSENFQFFFFFWGGGGGGGGGAVKISIYLNRYVLVIRFGSLASHRMLCKDSDQNAMIYSLT